MTAVAGPASNFLVAFLSIIALAIIWHGSNAGIGTIRHADIASPLATLFYFAMSINVVLAVFNLIPLPPLDGSHVVRHMLPYNWLRAYDSIGMIGLILVFLFGGRFIGMIVSPMLNVFNHILLGM
jgi:Zn-dependent protease